MIRTTMRRMGLILGLSALLLGVAMAQDATFQLTIKDHRFQPEELVVPAGQKIKLVIRNEDPTPEEFESHSLKREKIIPGGATGIIYLNSLKPGTYEFVGEFHEDTAKGRLIAK